MLDEYDEITDPTEKKEYRDAVVSGRMLAIDLWDRVFKKAIYKEGVRYEFSR